MSPERELLKMSTKNAETNLTPPTNRGVSLKTVGQSIDWITATTAKTRIGMAWFDIWLKIAEENGVEFSKPWAWMGYEGSMTDGARWGKREDGFILVVSGYRADLVCARVEPTASNITRLDLAVTIELEDRLVGLCRDHYNAVTRSSESQRKYSIVENKSLGQTVYVGSRASNQYGRIYDKSQEEGKQAGWKYRYEVVFKQPLAKPHLLEMHTDRYSREVTEKYGKYIRSTVWNWFYDRDIVPLFYPESVYPQVVQTQYRATTIDRKFEWLRRSVSPTIAKLMKSGRKEDVITSLGLEQFVELHKAEFDELG